MSISAFLLLLPSKTPSSLALAQAPITELKASTCKVLDRLHKGKDGRSAKKLGEGQMNKESNKTREQIGPGERDDKKGTSRSNKIKHERWKEQEKQNENVQKR